MLLQMQVAAFVATVLLLAVFWLAHSRHPSSFSSLWLAGWFFYALRFLLDSLLSLLGPNWTLTPLAHEATATSAVLLLLAVTRLSAEPVLTWRQAGAVWLGLTGWIVVSPAVGGFTVVSVPLYFAFGAIQLYTALLFYRYLRQFDFASSSLIVGAMGIWGIHKLDYPFLRPVEWFAPYGYAIGAVIALLTGLGVVMFLLEDAEREAREQREAAQRTSAEYQSLFDNLSDPVFIHGKDGEFHTVNETAVDRLGYSKAEFRELSVADIAAASYAEAIDDRRAEIFESGSATFRSAHVTADGETVPVEVNASTIRYHDDEAILSVARDITDQVHREEALEKFKQASEAAGHAIYITETDGTIEYVNPAFESVTGYSEAEALGRNPRILRSGEMPEDYYEDLWETLLDGEVWEEEVVNRRRDGEIYHAHQTIAPISVDGEIEAFVAIQTDISERKAQQERLQRYKQTIESSSNLLAAVDTDGNYLFANAAYREFHGIDEGAVAGRGLSSVLPSGEFDAIEPAFEQALEGESVSLDRTRESTGGVERTFDIQYFPLETTEGQIQGVGVALRDVTEMREQMGAIQELSEYRRVMSAVNTRLVKAETTQEILPEVTEELSTSDLFGCTFIALTDDDVRPGVVCSSESSLDEETVAGFHDSKYLERVFKEGLVRIDDVTVPPFKQHVTEQPSHEGVGIAITHEGERIGVLTVHFPAGEDVREIELRLLRELAADLGLFLHSQSLEQNLRTFKQIAERIDDPIMLQDREGNFEVVNSALAKYANRPKESLIGTDETAFMDETSAARIRVQKERTLESEKPIRYEVSPTLPGKGERTFSTIRYPHYDEDGTLDGTVAICRDVTDLKERERHLQVIDRVLRHNVNNNMTVVEGFAEMIRQTTNEPETARYATKIIDNSQSLVTTVQKERNISKVLAEPHSKREMDLVARLEAAVETVRTHFPTAKINADLPDTCEITTFDAIGQAVEELLTNAVVHSDLETPEVTVSLAAENGVYTIQVADDGPGIPEMERKVLTGDADIEPLYHGSGLGLWLVNMIVRETEGYLQFDENEPRGSVVTISLSP